MDAYKLNYATISLTFKNGHFFAYFEKSSIPKSRRSENLRLELFMKEIFGQPIQHVSSDSEDTDDLIEKISFVDQPGEIEGGRQKQSKITTCKVTGPVKGVTGSNFGVTFGRLYRCIVFGSLQAFS